MKAFEMSSLKSEGQSDVLVDQLAAEALPEYPTKWRLLLILCCLILGTFLVAIDTTIISVAIPSISTDFHALVDVGWYGSVYLMTLTAFQPTMGKIYALFPPKIVYLISIAIFEGTFCVI